MNKLDTFVRRLNKIGIDLTIVANYPWIYIDKINGKKVTELYRGNHGFTVAFMPIRRYQKLKLNDITTIFKLIRKYIRK